MFRFIDTAVEPGRSYRYRVRFDLWNPNVNLPTQHLADATLAKPPKLAAPPSEATAAVRVPDPTTVLLGTLGKAAMKKWKPGWVELLVLGPSETTGTYALRGLVTEPGGLANVDAKLNKPGDRRTRGEEIRTDRVVIDVRGRQEERTEQKSSRPAEPFELLCLRPDGSFEFVSAADSAEAVAAHAATLPAPDAVKPDTNPGATDPAASPFGGPF